MVTAFLLVLTAIGFATKSLTQLKFYVGASEPSNLSGKHLGEFLEQGDVHPFEPTGPLNGLLYTWVERLIDAPMEIQQLAQLQFRNGAIMVALLASLTITETAGSLGVSQTEWLALSSWVGTAFLLLAAGLLSVGRPWRRLDKNHAVTSSSSLALLILLPLAGPLLAAPLRGLGPQTSISVYPGVFLVLITAIGIFCMCSSMR
jgi:hypothetical protein